jgi:MFS family permease
MSRSALQPPPRAAADRRLIYGAAFLRAVALGMIGVLLGIYLAKLSLGPAEIGYVVAAGLAGATLAAVVVTFGADRLSRRRWLVGLAVVGAVGATVVAVVSQPVVIGAAAFLGMVNGMGRDRGASLILEQAILPATVPDRRRTLTFAWYNVLQDMGAAVGSLLAGLPALLRGVGGLGDEASVRLVVGLYALLTLIPALVYLRLSPAVEVEPEVRPEGERSFRRNRPAPRPGWTTGRAPARVSPETRRVLWRICPLFAVDSLGGGFLTTALLSFFFYERFAVGVEVVGILFFAARLANALSHLGAAWLARRIGLVNTMVFTHIPSSLLLVTVPFAPGFAVAAALFVLREGLVEMDVPTRQSYTMAVVRPEERAFAAGITHLVRIGAWAVAPSVAGAFMQGVSLATPIFIGAGLKVAYDVLLWVALRRVRPPEEIASA